MIEFVQERKAILIVLSGFAIVAFLLVFLSSSSQGALVTSRSDTLSDSRPSVAANHTVTFTLAAGDDIAEGETVVVDFGGASDVFNIGSVGVADIDFEVGATDHALVAVGGCGAPANELTATITPSTDAITFTRCTSDGAIASGSVISVKVGTNADGGTNQITNSTAGVQDVTIAGTFQATQVTSTVKVAVISGVSITATVSETLTFSIAGLNAASCTSPTGGTDIASTSTSIAYGTLTSDAFFDACQDITAATNAAGGYTTTVKILDELQAGANEIARGNCDGACNATTSAAWVTAGNNGFAYCMQDTTGTGSQAAGWLVADQCNDGTPLFRIPAVNPGDTQNETPVNIMQFSASASHLARIAHRLSIDALQAAGDYTGTIVYVTTPTY